MVEVGFIENTQDIVLIGVVILFVLILLIVFVFERASKKKLDRIINDKTLKYRIKIEKLKRSRIRADRRIKKVDEVARSFIKEAYGMEKNIEYSALSEQFQKMNKTRLKRLCDIFVDVYYKENRVNRETVEELINILDQVIKSHYAKSG